MWGNFFPVLICNSIINLRTGDCCIHFTPSKFPEDIDDLHMSPMDDDEGDGSNSTYKSCPHLWLYPIPDYLLSFCCRASRFFPSPFRFISNTCLCFEAYFFRSFSGIQFSYGVLFLLYDSNLALPNGLSRCDIARFGSGQECGRFITQIIHYLPRKGRVHSPAQALLCMYTQLDG